jgi:hypothetical protein
MNSKIINVVLVCLFDLCIAGKANAGLIVGELYEDTEESGLFWEYVGSFDLASGENWSTATPYNGLEAAVINFGGDISQYAIAAYRGGTLEKEPQEIGDSEIGDRIVNHLAWYDGSATNQSIRSESILVDQNGNGIYDRDSDYSAFVNDRAGEGLKINYVFKVASVPEPSTLAIFMLALAGLTTRHFKKK